MSLAQKIGSTMVGFHAYAARLHQGRFGQLETSLPQKYQEPGALAKQRMVHASLIGQGLDLISRSYLQRCSVLCRERGILFEERIAEGKNYAEIIKEANQGYDLVAIGARGLGSDSDDGQSVGSVCSRVVRRLVEHDVLVLKQKADLGGTILVALDGSPCSKRGFHLALALAGAFGGDIEAVSAFDTEFHHRVFQNLVGVLSDEAGKIFQFQEQERLHQDVIDGGMAKLCQEHLNWAEDAAKQMGVPFRGQVLTGKAATTIARHVRQRRPCLVVAGRFGAHYEEGMDLGSTVEALFCSSPVNLLIAANRVGWDQEARQMLDRVPRGVLRELTRQRVEELARRDGEQTVSPEVVAAKYSQWAQGAAQAQSELSWTPAARERVERVPAFIRGAVVKSIERYALMKGANEVTAELVSEAKAYWENTGDFHLR
ncbi:MAG: universal stress protein [Chloroflexi bacterium]|nr:universal stress protein [Chloroflexota bacterium]